MANRWAAPRPRMRRNSNGEWESVQPTAADDTKHLAFCFVVTLLGLLAIFIPACFLFGRNSNEAPAANFTATFNKSAAGSWNDSKLLNMNNFKWTRNNDSICRLGPHVDAHLQQRLLLILVNSARENYPQRSVVRAALKQMAVKVSAISEWTIRLVFLVGEAFDPDNSAEKDVLQLEDAFLAEEESMFKDLVGGNFIDTSDNLTLKTMMGIKWALTYCPEATFVVKMDDDTFFNVPKFVEWRNLEMRQAVDKTEGAIQHLPQLYCIPEKGRVPIRKPSNETYHKMRWLVTTSEWPGDTFPTYCNGLLYGMTRDLLEKVYQLGPSISYFHLEDIFVTGEVLDNVRAKFGPIPQRLFEEDMLSPENIKTICDNKVLRQTVSKQIGLAVELKRGHPIEFEKQMMCLAKEVSLGNN